MSLRHRIPDELDPAPHRRYPYQALREIEVFPIVLVFIMACLVVAGLMEFFGVLTP